MPAKVVANYYQDRERASVAMSRAAAEPGIKKIHLELARRYAKLAGGTDQSLKDGFSQLSSSGGRS